MDISTKKESATIIESVGQHCLSAVVCLVGIVGLAIALRLFRLGEWSFWIDEVITVNASAFIGDWSLAKLPIYLVLTRVAVEIFGFSEWSARIMPAFIGIITIPLLFYPIRRFYGQGVALISSLLLAVSPWHLYWSQNARFYALMLLLYCLGLFYFYRGVEESDWKKLVIAGIFLIFAIRERETALLFVPALFTYYLLLHLFQFERPKWQHLRYSLLVIVPALFIFAIDLYFIFSRGSSYLWSVFSHFLGDPIDDPFRLTTFIFSSMGYGLGVLAGIAGIYLIHQKNRAGLFAFCMAVVPTIILIALSPFMFAKDRYIFMTLPFWLILAGIAIHTIWEQVQPNAKWLAMGVLLLLVGEAMGDNLLYYTVNNGHRRDWRGAFALVEQDLQPDDIVISTRPKIGEYYLGRDVVWFGDFDPTQATDKRVWYVNGSESMWLHRRKVAWLSDHAQLLDVWTLRTPESMSLRLYLYEPE